MLATVGTNGGEMIGILTLNVEVACTVQNNCLNISEPTLYYHNGGSLLRPLD